MQNAAEEDVHDKQQRQRVKEKIITFRNNHEDAQQVSRDVARTLFDAIERDFDGNDSERAFIVREIQEMRNSHSLRDDPTEPVRDLPVFWDGLDRLLYAKDLARREAPPAVASRKNIPASTPTEEEPTVAPDVAHSAIVDASQILLPSPEVEAVVGS